MHFFYRLPTLKTTIIYSKNFCETNKVSYKITFDLSTVTFDSAPLKEHAHIFLWRRRRRDASLSSSGKTATAVRQ